MLSLRDRGQIRRSKAGLILILAVLAALAGPVGSVPAALAQFGSCSLPPVMLPLFAATPAASLASPAAPVTGLAARPLTDDEQVEVDAAVRAIVACVNTGVPKNEYAIFTPRYLAALFTGPHPAYQPAFEQMIAEGSGGPVSNAPPFVLKSLADATMLEDGRVVVTIALAGRAVTYHDTLVLVKIGNHWFIDEVTRFDPPLATPPA